MIFHATQLQGVFEIHLEPQPDERGFFARSWCQEALARHSLHPKIVQCSVSFNARKGTLRGLHYLNAWGELITNGYTKSVPTGRMALASLQ